MADQALVTGGAGGLGRALARALAQAGHQVALLGRSAAALEDARGALRASGVRVETVVADVASRPAVEAALASLGAPPLVLVNAAGIARSSPLLPPDDRRWDETFAANARGPWVVSTACLPAMRAAGRGAIVNVASTAALEGFRYTAAYVASKHALLGLTRAMAADLDGSGVTVSAVCPGFLDTPMTDRTVENVLGRTGLTAERARAAIAAMNASGRLIPPAEVARAIVDLLGNPDRHGAIRRIE
jgi:NAD(P)-dependent dehydrogenase (short-subunit alcohol dehydrogenase family)